MTEPTEVVKVDGELKRVGTWYPERISMEKPIVKKAQDD